MNEYIADMIEETKEKLMQGRGEKFFEDLRNCINEMFQELRQEGIIRGASLVTRTLLSFKDEIKNVDIEDLLIGIQKRINIEFQGDKTEYKDNFYHLSNLIEKMLLKRSNFLKDKN